MNPEEEMENKGAVVEKAGRESLCGFHGLFFSLTSRDFDSTSR